MAGTPNRESGSGILRFDHRRKCRAFHADRRMFRRASSDRRTRERALLTPRLKLRSPFQANRVHPHQTALMFQQRGAMHRQVAPVVWKNGDSFRCRVRKLDDADSKARGSMIAISSQLTSTQYPETRPPSRLADGKMVVSPDSSDELHDSLS